MKSSVFGRVCSALLGAWSLILGGCGGSELDGDIAERRSALHHLPDDSFWPLPPVPPVKVVRYAGSSVTLGAGDNDAGWLLNMTDSFRGEFTELSATIAHDSLLNSPAGLDHLAIGIRGPSVDALLGELGLPLAAGTFIFGEPTGRIASQRSLQRALAGRGITLWPVGSPYCRDLSRPCAIFENYTINLTGDGLVCASGRAGCSGAVALDMTGADYQVFVSADDYDVSATISQSGVVKASLSCRDVSTTAAKPFGDTRCAPQLGDVAHGDAFIANVVYGAPVGRRVGVTDVSVRVVAY
jgi:hypothetical protein